MMKNKLNQHKVEWTEEKVKNFWSFLSSNEEINNQYFSNTRGKALISYVSKYLDFEGRVLDFGCGKGFLLGHLLKKGIACEGLDFSEDSIMYVNDRFKNNALFKGARKISGFPLPFDDGSIDVVFFVETIEHLLEEQVSATLLELNRVLRKGGVMVVTTPNNESLRANEVMCPDCHAVFHKVQHMRSFTSKELSSLLEDYGFTVKKSKAVTLAPSSVSKLPLITWRILYRILGKEQPHLVCIAAKK